MQNARGDIERNKKTLTHRSACEARRGGRGCAAEDRRGRAEDRHGRVGQPRGHIAVDVVAGEDAVAADMATRAEMPYAVTVHGAQAVGWSNWRPQRWRTVIAPALAASTRRRSPRLPASTEKTWHTNTTTTNNNNNNTISNNSNNNNIPRQWLCGSTDSSAGRQW